MTLQHVSYAHAPDPTVLRLRRSLLHEQADSPRLRMRFLRLQGPKRCRQGACSLCPRCFVAGTISASNQSSTIFFRTSVWHDGTAPARASLAGRSTGDTSIVTLHPTPRR